MRFVAEGKLDLKTYSNNKQYVKMIRCHIKDRLILFGILDNPKYPIYQFCKSKFPDIFEELNGQINSNAE
ncbi:MAG: hypothetical protein IJY90_03060 [Clostridia bacterium]|nr:hypothetical protein [Clostridia bacterium]